jgi:hypothetical protein
MSLNEIGGSREDLADIREPPGNILKEEMGAASRCPIPVEGIKIKEIQIMSVLGNIAVAENNGCPGGP